ncbi:hypothetical protein FACS1894181_14600 [Bacteroidia bacterium]|nr:hypothetical protein FACS1894181_14600 [Bacteroidia bacterium]
MDIYAQKLDLIHWLTELNDASVLELVQTIKEKTETVSDAEKVSIAQGLDDLRQGKVHTHSQVKKRYEKWL